MGKRKAIKLVCVTALFAVLGTVTALAADAGQASGTNVNVRAEATTSADALGKINKGTEYTVLGKDGNWFKISYNGNEGFVSGDYFVVTKADANIDGSGVNLREQATTASGSLGKFSKGDYVCVTGQNDGWYRISHNGGSAYVSKDYVTGDFVKYVPKFENVATSANTNASADKNTSTDKNTSASNVYGVVVAESGLKLRQEGSLSGAVLGVLPKGTEVDVDKLGQEWIKVTTDSGQTGYVSAEFLSIREGERTSRDDISYSSEGLAVAEFGKQFIGTPYVWGGTDLNKGVDCSGFVYAVYKNFGVTLNRNSASMTANGVEVSKSNLQAGDLVFFNAGGDSKISHVGIYCGDGTYVHSTDGKIMGVTVTDLNSGYSANTYVTARRILR